jgi:acetyl-CoA carboxylase carboxyl transferase subunit alpha
VVQEENPSSNLETQPTPEGHADAAAEVAELRARISQLQGQLQQEKSAWDHVQLSRHEKRPHCLDYIQRIFSSFREIHGDRKYADDPAIVGGFAVLEGKPVMVIGQQKGRNTRDRLHRNYGMPKPEGYRKALRLMLLAEKFNRPILTLIDTPGAYPGTGAEERGQAEAIAFNLRSMAQLRVPVVVTVLGEGGSGGALAIGLGDRILMLEHAVYSVISPESCSAILWKDQQHAREAAENLRLTARHLSRFGIVDEIVPEPNDGAHTDWDEAARMFKERLLSNLEMVAGLSPEERIELRYRKFRVMGQFLEE